MRVLLILGLLAFLVASSFAENDDDNIGFDEESSGDGDTMNTEFPTDDEDIESDSEGSGTGTDANVAVDEDTDIENEPEVTGGNGKNANKGVKVIDDPSDSEDPVTRIDNPEEKAVDENNDLEDEETEADKRDDSPGPEFMAAVVAGGCIGLLFAICVIMLLVYRMRKKDEGSYALEYGLDGKKPQGNYEYTKGVDSKEYFA